MATQRRSWVERRVRRLHYRSETDAREVLPGPERSTSAEPEPAEGRVAGEDAADARAALGSMRGVVGMVLPVKRAGVVVPVPGHVLVRVMQVIAVCVRPHGERDLLTLEVDVGVVRDVDVEAAGAEAEAGREERLATRLACPLRHSGPETEAALGPVRRELQPTRG